MLICAATGNAGKLKEIRRILEAQGHTVKSQKELGITLEPEETGTTFAENARIKAKAICEAAGLPTLADDSGLAVDALDGAPGVYSARYGNLDSDQARTSYLLENLKDVPAGKRGAQFVSAIVCILPDGREVHAQGTCQGEILFAPRGENGFGYDPVFYSPELKKTFSEATEEEKSTVSHRGRALRAFLTAWKEAGFC